jgi:glycosyltransferase involved in cell wall biosynthesis
MNSEHEIIEGWGGEKRPVVSVICPTYNHEKYIRKTIESILSQRTDFPFELFIHDDASTDSTASIIEEYAKAYPSIIRPIYRKENQYSKGYKIQPLVMPHTNGKYIAFCEGDDFWTNPQKLQHQVDILNKYHDVIICGHWCTNVDGQGALLEKQITTGESCPEYFGAENALSGTPVHPNTWMYRRMEWQNHKYIRLLNALPAGDDPTMLMLLSEGKGYCISNFYSAYRLHDGGSWSTKSNYRKSFDMLRFYVSSLYLIPMRLYLRQGINIQMGAMAVMRHLLVSVFQQRSIAPIVEMFGVINSQKTMPWLQVLGIFFMASVFWLPLMCAIRIRRRIKALFIGGFHKKK